MERQLSLRWLYVILGILFVSVVITILFLLINRCISRRGKHKIQQLQKRSAFPVESNKYQETNLNSLHPLSTPPLPPRTQFLTAAAQSYENLAETDPDHDDDIHDYEDPVEKEDRNHNHYEQALSANVSDINNYEQPMPDYEQDKFDYVQPMPDYEQDRLDYEEPTPDYEQDQHSLPDYEEVNEEQLDYVKVEPDEEGFPPPPPQFIDAGTTDDDASTEDYDDIGEDENLEEDYDDVG